MDYVRALSQKIADVYNDIKNEQEQKDGRAQIATVIDSTHVDVGGQKVLAEVATDIYMRPGALVYVQLTAEGNAVVIGD